MATAEQHHTQPEGRSESQSRSARPERSITHAQSEAFKGFESFDRVRSAMAPNGNAALGAFDRGGAPSIEGAAFAPGKGQVGGGTGQPRDNNGEINPPNQDRYKTPSLTPDQYQLRKGQKEGAVIDENGRTVDKRPAQDGGFTAVPVDVQRGADGRVKSVSTDDPLSGRGKTTFEPNGRGGMTRTREMGGGLKEVEQFGRDGKPISREMFTPGSDKGLPQTPDRQDRLTMTKNADGSTTINSQDHGNRTNTSIVLDKDGNVVSRSVEKPDSKQVTEFNSDGSPKSDTLTEYDTNHKVKQIQKVDKDASDTQVFDAKGNVVKSIHDDGQNLVSNERKPDGTTISTAEDAYGGKHMVVNSPNGDHLEMNDDGRGNRSSKLTRADGSSFEMKESHQYLTYKSEDAAGNWQFIQRDKQTGIEKGQRGHGDVSDPRITRVPI